MDTRKERGHDFQPRYDVVAPKWLAKETRRDWLAHAGVPIEHLHERIYVHDICVRCGKVVSRNDAALIDEAA